MTDTAEKTPAQAAAQIIIDALHDARDNAVTEASIRAMDRAILVAMESGVLVTETGEAVSDVLDELYAAMPAPRSNRVAAPWEKAMAAYYTPRYRVAGLDKPDAPLVLTDTLTGAQRVWDAVGGEAAPVRAALEFTDCGKGVTRWGVGVRGADTDYAKQLIEGAA